MVSLEEQKEMVGLLMNLVATRTVNPPGDEAMAAEVLSAFLDGHGLEAQLDEVEEGRPNLLCTVGRGTGRSLLFDSHLDVVSPGDPNSWRADPFGPYVEVGKLYGRGACDDKASLAAMAMAMVQLAAQEERLCGRVTFAAVMGEEITGAGSSHLAEKGITADAAVVGEPTHLRVMTGQKGRVGLKLGIPGRAAHASQPQQAINPIERAAEVIQALRPFCREIQERRHPLLGNSSLVFTILKAGDKQNVIPDHAVVEMDYRVVPPWTPEQLVAELRGQLGELSKRLGYPIGLEHEVLSMMAFTPEDEQIVQTALGLLPEYGVKQSEPEGFTACCDMHFFRAIGIPTIILGPGGIEQAHTVDEYVELDEVFRAAEIYREMALRFLSAE
ncbi:MAG: M20 family metallopeptidase [Candidatus Latescibacterota bacterium]